MLESVVKQHPTTSVTTDSPPSEITLSSFEKSSALFNFNSNSDKLDSYYLIKEYARIEGCRFPHVQQRFSWDCGLACAEMALKARGIHDVALPDLRQVCTTVSVWTIDLAFLLKSFGFEVSLYTISSGVREEYKKQAFYQKHLKEDAERVENLFERAQENNIKVELRSVSSDELKYFVQIERGLVVVLVDKRYLQCTLCNRSTQLISNSLMRLSPGFLGHYVLICGYNSSTDSYLIKDPATNRNSCVVRARILENARKAFGTDEDVLYLGKISKQR